MLSLNSIQLFVFFFYHLFHFSYGNGAQKLEPTYPTFFISSLSFFSFSFPLPLFQQMAFRCRTSLADCVRNADSTENPPPPPPPSGLDLGTVSLTFFGSVIAATTLLGVYYLVIARFRSNLRQRSIGNPTTSPRIDPPILFDTHEEFFDEEQGPQLDHPIWYIHTIGLDQSAIDSIAAFKFKKGEGLIDGTDCSVCLTEFEDDEALRLLPNCSHAFHVACIDMWLRSHKNCPLCRAPVVKSAPAADEADNAANSSPAGNSTSDDGARVSEIEEGESSGGGAITLQNEEAVVKGLRRSVSMDAASASEIYRAVGVAINGGGRERMKKAKNLSFSSTSRTRIIGTSFRLYRTMKSCSFGHERRNMLLP